MSTYATLVGAVLPYVAIGVFVIGMAYRFKVWFTTKQPGKMKLYKNQEEPLTSTVIKEALFFPSLFKGDRTLWYMSWFFHVTLALVFVGHFRVVTGLIDGMLRSFGMTNDQIYTMSSTSGGIAGVVLLATGLLLLVRRFTIPRVREISGAPDFIALLLVIAIVGTGNIMRFAGTFNLEHTRIWAGSLLAFSPSLPNEIAQDPMFLTHALLAFILIMFIPFS